MNSVTNEDVKRLVKLAESPALDTLEELDLLDAGMDALDTAITKYTVQIKMGEGGPHAEEKLLRVQFARCALFERRDYVALKAATYATVAEAEDKILMGLLTVPASRNSTKH